MEERPEGIPTNANPVFEGTIFTIWQWEQELYDGTKAIFERASRGDAAFILMALPDKRLMLITDSQPDRNPLTTVPGGKLEVGENPLEGAKRELLEETGFEAKTITPWFTIRYPGKLSFAHHFFIGTDVHKIQEPKLDAGERIEPQPVTFEEFIELFKNMKGENSNTLRTKVLELLVFPEKMSAFKKLLYPNE